MPGLLLEHRVSMPTSSRHRCAGTKIFSSVLRPRHFGCLSRPHGDRKDVRRGRQSWYLRKPFRKPLSYRRRLCGSERETRIWEARSRTTPTAQPHILQRYFMFDKDPSIAPSNTHQLLARRNTVVTEPTNFSTTEAKGDSSRL